MKILQRISLRDVPAHIVGAHCLVMMSNIVATDSDVLVRQTESVEKTNVVSDTLRLPGRRNVGE